MLTLWPFSRTDKQQYRTIAKAVGGLLLAASLCGHVGVAAAESAPRADFIRADGKRLMAPDGGTFFVKGINLGHWLVQEG